MLNLSPQEFLPLPEQKKKKSEKIQEKKRKKRKYSAGTLSDIHLHYQPVIRDGIPELEEGTATYDDYWSEQWDRCLNGYQPEGHSWIPGNYYFYLNFWKISRLTFAFDPPANEIHPVSFPLYRKFDHELVMHHYECRKTGKNSILGKFRRAGITDICIGSEVAYGLLFLRKNQNGIGVPYDRNMPLIMPKLYTGLDELPGALYQGKIYDNAEELQIGYKYQDENGNWRKGGAESILFKKVFTKAGVFKGSWLYTLLMDEVGEMDRTPGLEASYLESMECVMQGGKKIGLIILAGTSDKINNKTEDYEKLYYNPEAYNLKPFFLPTTKWYYSESRDQFLFNFKTGVPDEDEADTEIDKQIEILSSLPDKVALFKFMQSHPRVPEDMFIVTTDSSLNVAMINEQIKRVLHDPEMKNRTQTGDLYYAIDESGAQTDEVLFRPNPMGKFHISDHPIYNRFRNADIGGVDDYMKDKAPHSDSKGAIVIYRRFTGADEICQIPVMTYWARPKLSEFFEDCLLAAKYYKCQLAFEMNTAQGTTHPIYEFFKAKRALHYLKSYPMLMGKPVRPQDAYGYPVREAERQVGRMRLAEMVDSPRLNNITDLRMLRQLTEFDKKNTDLCSALIVAMLYDADLSVYKNKNTQVISLSVQEQELLEPLKPVKKKFAFTSQDGHPVPKFDIGKRRDLFQWQRQLRERMGSTPG